MTKVTIALPEALHRAVEASVARGEHVDAGDYIRDLIRRQLADDEAMRAALIAGELSGRSPRRIADIIASERAGRGA